VAWIVRRCGTGWIRFNEQGADGLIHIPSPGMPPKKLGFSHVSARPKAYKRNAEAMDAFKKTSPSVWRKSARSSHPTHR
jgi:hypothetical protein